MGLPARSSHLKLLVLVVFLCSSCSTGSNEAPKPTPVSQLTGFEITAHELQQVYTKNEVAGDERFKGRVAAISGTVTEIAKIDDRPIVRLMTGDDGAVQCHFASDQSPKVAKLEIGKQVKIKGRIVKLYINVVLVDECMMP